MQREPTGGFARAIEPGNDLAVDVEYLTAAVCSKAGERVVQNRRGPRGMERRLLNLEHQPWSAELRVLSRIHGGVVGRDRFLERARWHRRELIRVRDLPRQLGDGVRSEEPAVGID